MLSALNQLRQAVALWLVNLYYAPGVSDKQDNDANVIPDRARVITFTEIKGQVYIHIRELIKT